MLNINTSKINRNYYQVTLLSKNVEHCRLDLYVEVKESELRKYKGRMREVIEESVCSYAQDINWEGYSKYEYTMFRSSIAQRINKLEQKYA